MSTGGVTVLAVAASLLAGAGAWLIWTAPAASTRRPRTRPAMPRWSSERAFAVFAAAVAGAAIGFVLFAAAVPALAIAIFAGSFPIAAGRRRASEQRAAASDAWPRVLEEIRLRTGSLGRSIPQALFEAGRQVPDAWRGPFRAAEREWMLTTDFPRTLGLLRHQLDDPTADAVCETLLIAHELGGSDLDGRLADLIEDRVTDLEGRRDAQSRLAGVRFARRFVLLVPLGMAAAGLTIGNGRQAYTSAAGQIAVVIGTAAVAACWWWSSRLMRMPDPPRVFR
jgi:tight adherence protein B